MACGIRAELSTYVWAPWWRWVWLRRPFRWHGLRQMGRLKSGKPAQRCLLLRLEPGISKLNIYYIFPIIFCLGLSYVAITLRQLSSTEPVWLISFYFSLAITLLSLLTIKSGWVMPSFNHFILLSFIGIFGGVSNLWLSQSYKYSEVSLVTPLKYLALLFAIIFGYFIWDEIPTIKTLVGAFLVIISTLIIFRREIYKSKFVTSKTIND